MHATITKVKDAEPLGEYQRTELDDRKDAADIRIVACDSKYTVMCKPGVELSGRGITQCGSGYIVTESALMRLYDDFDVATDF